MGVQLQKVWFSANDGSQRDACGRMRSSAPSRTLVLSRLRILIPCALRQNKTLQPPATDCPGNPALERLEAELRILPVRPACMEIEI